MNVLIIFIKKLFIFLSFFIFFIFTLRKYNDDQITKLPNFNGDIGKQFSGYICINKNTQKYLHYWFVHSESNIYNDPLILWLNGGPGCSSLDGYFYEQGPLHFHNNENRNNLTLYINPWRWNKISNIIFLEAPVGVGFSYSKTPSDYNINDNITADDNYLFLLNFFELYPEFKKNDFYIAGESYAGIYVPTLAERVQKDSSINFKGILVGNGVTDKIFDSLWNSFLPFFYNHGFFSDKTYNEIQEYCSMKQFNKVKCDDAISQVFQNVKDIDIYDIYSDCYHQRPNSLKYSPYFELFKNTSNYKNNDNFKLVPPCIDADKAQKYLNLLEVKNAIHVLSSIDWTICTTNIQYQSTIHSVIPIYKDLIKNKKRILIYSGDVDGAVPYVGTQSWINHLNLSIKKLWYGWKIPKWDGEQIAGYVTEYDGLTFVTVKGSGHMVPQFKPEAGYYMFQRFIEQKPL